MIALPRGHRVAALAAAAAFLVAGCSSTPTTTSSPVLLGTGESTSSPAPTATATTAPVDIPLDGEWVTQRAAADGTGYHLDLDTTGRPGVFDGRFYRQSADGSVSGQQVVTITVTAPDAVDVRWPDGQVSSGRLTVAGQSRGRTELALDPGCLAYLVDGSSQLDCRLYPAGEFGPSASPGPTASATPTATATPISLPGGDESMGYLCSVADPTMIDHVTGPDADPYTTAVLQNVLVAVGLDPGPVDGTYSEQTRRAVRAFQRSAGLAVDGLVGPRTWTGLQSAACTLASDPAGR